MSTPNFSELLKINQYLTNIDSLSREVERLKSEVTDTENTYSNKLKTEEYRLTQLIAQERLLKKISQEIATLRQDEFTLRMQVRGKISQAIDDYFQNGGFAAFVEELIKSLEKDGQKVTVLASTDTKDYVKGHDTKPLKPSGQLRVQLGNKTYVLDIAKVKEQLQARLLIQVLST